MRTAALTAGGGGVRRVQRLHVQVRGLDILAARRAYAIVALARPNSLAGLGMIWVASMTGNTTRCGLYRQMASHLWLLDAAGANTAFELLALQPPVAATWRLAVGIWAAYKAVRCPADPARPTPALPQQRPPPAGNSAYIRIGAWRDGAEPTVTDPYAGRIGTVIVLASSTAGASSLAPRAPSPRGSPAAPDCSNPRSPI